MLQVAAPKFEPKPFESYTGEDGQDPEALLKACEQPQEVRPGNRHEFTMRPPKADRNQALIVVLLDTCLRSGELCALSIDDHDSY